MRLQELLISINLTEGYREAEAEFTQAANNDVQGTKDLINAYKELVNRNQLQGNERNIDYWRKQGFNAFKQFVVHKQSIPTSTEVKRKKVPGKSITLKEDDNWLIVIPLDKNASCFHGKNSDWCTTKPNQNYFENYFYNRNITLIYCLNKQNAGMWAIAAHDNVDEIEMFDQQDNSIDEQQFHNETGLNPRDLVELSHNKTNKETLSTSREPFQDAMEKLRQIRNSYSTPDFSKLNPEIEKLLDITRDPFSCQWYVENRFYTSGKQQVKVSKPIILAIAKDYGAALEYIDFNDLSESFVSQVINVSGAVKPIIRAGYKFSTSFVNKLIQSTEESADKFAYIQGFISNKIPVSDELVIDIITNPYRADYITDAYIKAKTIPSDDVVNTLVSEYPESFSGLMNIGMKPSEKVIVTAIQSTSEPSNVIYELSKQKLPISHFIFGLVVNKAYTDIGRSTAALNCVVSMIVNGVMPTLEMFEDAKDHATSIAQLLINKGMPVPKELQELVDKDID